MRILLISSLTNDSGSGKRLWSIARELGRLGHCVHYLERAKKGTKKVAQNVVYHSSPVIASSLVLEIFVALIYNTVYCLFIRADIVFVLKPLPNSCIPGLLKRVLGAKIIVDVDDLDFEYYEQGLWKKIVHFCFNYFPPLFNKVSVHTDALKDYMIKTIGLPEKDILFLPQGVDYKLFAQTKKDDHLCKEMGLEGYKVLIYVASLGITSDLNYTFKAVKHVIDRVNNVKLLVIGGGNQLDNYRKMAEDIGIGEKVVFTGYIAHNQVSKYMALGDVALNYYEPNEANKYRSPIKIREYMALGVPVVCNLEGDTYLFAEYVWVFNSLDEYCEQIIAALNNSDNPKVKQGQTFISQNYNWETIAVDFEKTLLQLI
ncbi:MAG TPA: glycosyltransferase [Candidatus Dependentiae bacterium]|nr:glycosyltransferase [Candidatus Dependentiae bacterium]